MECQYRSANGRLFFKIEAGCQKDLFEGISKLQEVFEADSKCGCCQSPVILFRVREVTKGTKTFKYYEYRCTQCNAQLAFGQSQDAQTLFPKRKDEQGNWLPNHGWFKWQPKDDE